ncbi:hypothetical protein ACNO5E_24905 [Vibrio parahaemolyticus]|uniref:hypothetical protein n=1 Tax=Vibrio parahaemolyticus TaxID=670 RepID=UPI0008135476|nr:hypothetical protein [Vibrio parahaemolyticus]OCP68447.1 hypothetical protein AKH08_16690 [Vibrio parahaemolyticus]
MAWSKIEENYLETSAGKLPLSEISKVLNKSNACVKKKASRMNLSLSYFGSGCHRVNYDSTQIDRAKDLLATGIYTNREIAAKTDLPENYVSQIKAKYLQEYNPARSASQQLNAVFC